MELRAKTACGEWEWFEVRVNALWRRDPHVECVGLVGKLVNIHSSKMETRRLRREASTDPLTGVCNRKAAEERVNALLRSGRIKNGALAFIDIDNFKAINDTLGHQSGDETLQYVGGALQRLFRSTDVVGRVGGDEFIAFWSDIPAQADLERKAEAVCGIFREVVCKGEHCCKVSGSVGVARYPQDGDTYDLLLGRADRALYRAKHAGKDRFALYDGEMAAGQFHSVLSELEEG